MSHTTSVPLLPGPASHALFSAGETRACLERDILPGYVSSARWFGGKARRPRAWTIRDIVSVGAESAAARLVFLEIAYLDGASETYLLPLQIAAAETAAHLPPTAPVARFADGAVLFDALHDASFRAELYGLIAHAASNATLTGIRGPALDALYEAPPSRALAVEQSNSSIVYGDRVFLKLYRKLEEGVNPDAEILRFLAQRGFPHVPPFGGALEYRSALGAPRILALAAGMVPNDGDAWSFTLRHLAQFFASVLAGDAAQAQAFQEEYLTHAAQLGQRTGELHLALASDLHDRDFAPEPLAADDFAQLGAAIRHSAQEIRTLVAARLDSLDATTRQLSEQILAHFPRITDRADALPRLTTSAARTRTHGDYHLGQVLHGPDGFVIIDFEGEPMSSLAHRRRKMSPFRDVAGMLRSFHYAAHAALEPIHDHRARLAADAEAWAQRAQQTFLAAWRTATAGAVFRDPDPVTERALLDAFLLEKALYEVRYEVNNRPTWLGIPLRGVLALLDRT